MNTVAIISLGCNKNLVDSEVMAGYLKEGGFTLTSDPAQAETIIVNTCGFIEDAKTEAVDTILAMAQHKKKKCRALLVSGCLSQRYPEAIGAMPEVDGVLGTYAYRDIVRIVRDALNGKKTCETSGDPRYLDHAPARVISTQNYAYLKIAEGCSNGCSYCAIPSIRGKYVSRDMNSLLCEAAQLKTQGVREIVLTAQDTTRYGSDQGQNRFAELLEKIALLGFDWVRFLYAYPSTMDEKAIRVIEKYDNICKYIDMPIQHTQDGMLKRMNRHYDRACLEKIWSRLRDSSFDWTLRTTLMCGFPGETEADHKAMLRFIEEKPFDHVGVFAFSCEDGTRAETMRPRCRKSTALRRCDEIMLRQGEIAHARNKRHEGKVYKTFVEGFDEEQQCWFGRTEFLAPEVDGKVFFTGSGVSQGSFVPVLIEEAFGVDYFGRKSE